MMKKAVSLLGAVSILLSLAACSATPAASAASAYADTTIVGQITSISGSTVTLQVGELTAQSGPGGQKPASDDNTPAAGQAPDGASNAGTDQNGAPPEMPAGEADGNTPAAGQAPNGGTPPENGAGGTFTAGSETLTLDLSAATITKNGESVTADALAAEDILRVTFDAAGAVSEIEMLSLAPAMGAGESATPAQGDSANTITEDSTVSDTTYTSTGDDENALRIDGATATLSGIAVNKTAGATSSTENGDFYGVNAALLATNGANVTIQNATVQSSAQNGNGVFSYGSGTTVNISDSKIDTTADNSGGIQTTGGGTTNASNLTVHTAGNSSAAIRSDRGGGTVRVSGGSYTSDGYNSPAIYSTADIAAENATLTANHSEALVIEGENSITLTDCDVSGNMDSTKGTSSDENVHGVMIYQSMSGDADVGTAAFTMNGGSLTSNNGDVFYITNTHCVISLSGVSVTNAGAGRLMTVAGNSASHGWGTAGANGAQVECTAENQTLAGDIVVDSISTLSLTLKGKSTFTGTVNIIENAEGGAAVADNAAVTVESGSTWKLTGNCTLSSLENNGSIEYNGYTITLADGTVLGG